MRKKIFLFLVALLGLAIQMNAQTTEGMKFCKEGTKFAEAVAQAKVENKMVFLDCYTSWCGPCKMMARDIFPQKKVGDFMNPKFICIKIYMEKGEGPSLTQKFQVSAFPTFIIFNSDAQEIGRFLGGSDADGFIDRVKKASIDNGSIDMDKQWEQGNRDESFLKQYLTSLGNAYKNQRANDVAEALLDPKAESFASDSASAMIFMRYINNPFSKAFIYTAKHPNDLKKTLGETPVDMKLQSVWRGFVRQVLKTDGDKHTLDMDLLNKWVALMEECNVSNRDELRLDVLITANQKTKNWNDYFKYCKEYWNNKNLDVTDLQLCRWCSPLVKECQDEKIRKEAKKMVQQRMKDLQSGKRQPQKKQGNMILSGNLERAMQMLIDGFDGKEIQK